MDGQNTTTTTGSSSTGSGATTPSTSTGSNSPTKAEKIKQFNENVTRKKEVDVTEKVDVTETPQEKVEQKSGQKPLTRAELAEQARKLRQQQQQEELDTMKKLADVTKTLADKINGPINNATGFISRLPTPGGIAAILIAIAFFALVLIPVNPQGMTRLKLFWQTLMGRTHMKYRETLDVGGVAQTSSPGAFGTIPSSVPVPTGTLPGITPGTLPTIPGKTNIPVPGTLPGITPGTLPNLAGTTPSSTNIPPQTNLPGITSSGPSTLFEDLAVLDIFGWNT